jgi:hypothetical protein
MCPSSKLWQDLYIKYLDQMVALGVDGVELDILINGAGRCYSPDHGHPVGADMGPAKWEFLHRAREHVKGLKPDFILVGETNDVDARTVLDGYYTLPRYLDENGRIFRYVFPDIREQIAVVGTYAYDAANKALSLGVGIDTEVWGLRRIVSEACPELAQLVGKITALRRKHADILIHGVFRDTMGAKVDGSLYSVFEGPHGTRALVLRNATAKPAIARVTMDAPAGKRLILWQPDAGEKSVGEMPREVTLGAWQAAVVLAVDP